MRPLFDDLDELDFDDNPTVARLLREQWRDELRRNNRRFSGPKDELNDDYDDGFSVYTGYEEDDGYSDYDADEFDRYAGIGLKRQGPAR